MVDFFKCFSFNGLMLPDLITHPLGSTRIRYSNVLHWNTKSNNPTVWFSLSTHLLCSLTM